MSFCCLHLAHFYDILNSFVVYFLAVLRKADTDADTDVRTVLSFFVLFCYDVVWRGAIWHCVACGMFVGRVAACLVWFLFCFVSCVFCLFFSF